MGGKRVVRELYGLEENDMHLMQVRIYSADGVTAEFNTLYLVQIYLLNATENI